MRYAPRTHVCIAILFCLLLVACADDGDTQPLSDGDEEEAQTELVEEDSVEIEGEEVEETEKDQIPATNLISFARLRANETKPTFPFPWPREAEDTIATIRDDSDDTSYKAPDASLVEILIDPQPLLSSPVSPMAVESLEFFFTGGLTRFCIASDTSEAPRCATPKSGRAFLRLPQDDDSTPFNGRYFTLTLEETNAFEMHELSLIARTHAPLDYGQKALQNARPNVIEHATSGVIEGFYGVPWSWSERRAYLALLASKGLGAYLYAPKHDPLHRGERWREPYPDTMMEEFNNFNKLADEVGVHFIFGISPFTDYDDETDEDFNRLIDKLSSFCANGLRHFAILADDIEFDIEHPIDETLGMAHADIVNRLHDTLSADCNLETLLFTPTVYSDERIEMWEGGERYLAAIGSLHEEIGVLWTGLKTSGASMHAEEMRRVTELTGRKPIVWDNYWANDGGDGFTGRLPLGAFDGRDETLLQAVGGIMHNPSIQGAASRLSFLTFARFLDEPNTYTPALGIEFAVFMETMLALNISQEAIDGKASESNQSLLRFIMEIYSLHTGDDTPFEALQEIIDTIRAQYRNKPPAERLSLLVEALPLFARMAAIETSVHFSSIETNLADELAFPLKPVRYAGEAGIFALMALLQKETGRSFEAALEESEDALALMPSCRFDPGYAVLASLVDFVKAFEAREEAIALFGMKTAPEALENEMASIVINPFESDTLDVSVFGMPQASVTDEETIDWKPRHAGRYRAVVIGLPKDIEATPAFGIKLYDIEHKPKASAK